jgi:hypothetical protein
MRSRRPTQRSHSSVNDPTHPRADLQPLEKQATHLSDTILRSGKFRRERELSIFEALLRILLIGPLITKSTLGSTIMRIGEAKPVAPTFTGFVKTSMDGLILFQACLSGKLDFIAQRPGDKDRGDLIRSGNVFVYERDASGIKRWSDGVAWSPSRILGNFLVYRELDKPFSPGEKKRAIKRKRSSLPGVDGLERVDSGTQANIETPGPALSLELPVNLGNKPELPSCEQDKELERSLVGSLVDSYVFRAHGLVKKTMSISINGISHHMVSYYRVDDVKHNLLARPLQDPRLQQISVRPELYLMQNFRAPIEETEYCAMDRQTYAHTQVMCTMAIGCQTMRPGQQYPPGRCPGMHAPMTTSNAGGAVMYGVMPGNQWAEQPAIIHAGHPSYTAASFYGGYYRSCL